MNKLTREQIEAWRSLCWKVAWLDGPLTPKGQEELNALCDLALAAMENEKDARRYRWLRETDWWDSPIVKLGYDDYETAHGEELDAAIDAALNDTK